jgi:dihydroflavonol-4-reductase
LERVAGVAAPLLSVPRSRAVARVVTSLAGRAVAFAGGQLPVDPVSLEMGELFWYVDSTRAERELGFAPRDPLDTLSDTVRDLRG